MSEKTALVIRQGFDADFICSRLANLPAEIQPILIFESGCIAQKAKMKRILKNRKFRATFDLVALGIYDRFQRMKMSQVLPRTFSDSHPVIELFVKDINSKELRSFIEEKKITRILNYGTALYSESTLDSLNIPIINFHSGVLPKYRNVHTDFWAYLNRDFDGMGVSVFLVSKEIDNGSLIATKNCEFKPNHKLWNYKAGNLCIVANLIEEFILRPNDLSRTPICRSIGHPGILWPTPEFSDILKYFVFEASNSFKR